MLQRSFPPFGHMHHPYVREEVEELMFDKVYPFLTSEKFTTTKFQQAYSTVFRVAVGRNGSECLYDAICAMFRSCLDSVILDECKGAAGTPTDLKWGCAVIAEFVRKAKKTFMYLERFYLPKLDPGCHWEPRVKREFVKDNRAMIDEILERMRQDCVLFEAASAPMLDIGLLSKRAVHCIRQRWLRVIMKPHVKIDGVVERVVEYLEK